MTNHVHLLLTPGDVDGALARLMKALAARTTRYRNRLEGRTGTLWESRYKSSPIQSDRYLLACVRYIELNPVRAGMVQEAADYPWSSYRQRMGLVGDAWFHPDSGYLGLGDSEPVRRSTAGNRDRFIYLSPSPEFRWPGWPSLSRDPEGWTRKNRSVPVSADGLA